MCFNIVNICQILKDVHDVIFYTLCVSLTNMIPFYVENYGHMIKDFDSLAEWLYEVFVSA
jgi:hypothetical protein